ncbi:hypothetical protein [Microbacterium sp. VKM Ac-2923]|uniref:hypothetical protein n=1 Tax=Microbacterium sp. VKM Ac-2923 TaxID=2929476 RepID=UPI001FB485ED|nr:hypothetical protein [Microbacterium sp. VKM Ac-2923]MCJ1709224.1 hypothetical protein [Microbacterium sp. VKM Ac-2923]
MAFNPGRNIGRVSIRVVPDTKNFNKDARRQLNDAARTVRARIKVDGADFDKEAVKKDLERQLNGVEGLRINAYVKATVDSAKVNKTLVRKSIQAQFDEMSVRVGIEAHVKNAEDFKREVHKMIDDAEGKSVDVPVNPQTAAAAAQLRYTARDRMVTFFAKTDKASVAAVASTFAALSGARLAGQWADDLGEFFRDLDKNLPSILTATTGITSIVAGLSAAVGSLVSVGQGLFSISPALLVLPGLALNAIGSLTALIVAWKDAGNQLEPLADGMNEIGEIINSTYWDQARQPILDLVNGLMPQMRNAFRDLSHGVGEFTGALAKAFGEELGGGRFEAIFGGIAEGWRVLGTGASGFAGAIVSLSEIAAKYTPRLAAWFVRQANTFDAWLEAIAKDGRLGAWMESAIDSMYDLWDATTGIAGVFEGIYTAAAAAGSEGLEGFAKLMQQWEQTVKSADFQKGLSAVFRGSYAAMDAFGEAIKGIGRLIADLSGPIERFIGSSGEFLGGLVEAIANALNTPVFAKGLDDFSSGLTAALDGIKPALHPIADTFGGFLGLLGNLAENVLPTAANAIAQLTPSVDSLMGVVERVTPGLTTAVDNFVNKVAPPINDLVVALGPAIQTTFEALGTALDGIAPTMESLTTALSPTLVSALTGLADALKPLADLSAALLAIPTAGFQGLKDLSFIWDNNVLDNAVREIAKQPTWIGDLFTWAAEVDGIDLSVTPSLSPIPEDLASKWTGKLRSKFETGGQEAADAMWSQLKTLDPSVLSQIESNLSGLGITLNESGGNVGRGAGARLSSGFMSGFNDGKPAISTAFASLRPTTEAAVGDTSTWLTSSGTNAMLGFKTGSEGQKPGIAGWFASLGTPFGDAMSAASTWLLGRGGETMGGFRSGAEGGTEATKGVFSGLNGNLTSATSGSNMWLTGRGSDAMGGFGSGAEGRKWEVSGVFGGLVGLVGSAIPNPWGLLIGAGSSIMGGFLSGLKSAYEGVKTFVSGIASWIRDNKGPEAYDRQLLVPAGGWIMDGFQRGLERGFGRVQSRVAGMAAAIRDEFSTGLNGEIGAGIDLSANAARSIAASAKAKADQDASARAAQGQGSKTYVLQGLTTRETAEEIAEEIDKKERRSIVRTGALPTTEVT